MRRLAIAAVMAGIGAAATPGSAAAHSLVRSGGGLVSYVSADATSLNTLVVSQRGDRIEFRDESVDGGMDPGSCTPGDVDSAGFIVQTFCPLAGVRRIRIDLADREDRATVALDLPVTLLGGSGADSLTGGAGVDEITGGEGNDGIAGGPGDDVISGDQGADSLDGGDGGDRIGARDGEADTVTCGPGADTVDADGADAVAADCESVTRTATAPPAATADDGRPPKVDAGAPTVQRVGRARVVRVYATTSKPGTLAASGSLEAAGLRLPITRVARARVRVPGAGAELTYRLSGRNWRVARGALRRGKRVTVRLVVVGTDLAGRSARRKVPAVRLVRGAPAGSSSALLAARAAAAPARCASSGNARTWSTSRSGSLPTSSAASTPAWSGPTRASNVATASSGVKLLGARPRGYCGDERLPQLRPGRPGRAGHRRGARSGARDLARARPRGR